MFTVFNTGVGRRNRRFRRLTCEPLESRRVLASAVTISEFMANNDDTLVDYYNQTSDWIELHNTSGGNIDLEGWYLTDEPGNLNKWQIPIPKIVGPNQYEIVFASNRDEVAPNGELHADFTLSSSGDYLALVEPDGSTIAWEASPQFPPQFNDVSFGTFSGSVVDTLVTSGDAADVLVPQTAGELSAAWRDRSFAATDWISGTTAVGYDRGLPLEPDRFSGLQLWLKADDIVPGAEPAVGSSISSWRDHSGDSNDAQTVTDLSTSFVNPTRQEVTQDGQSFPVIRFTNSANQLMRASDLITTDTKNDAAENENFGNLTLITVYSTSSTSSADRPLGFGAPSSSGRGGQNSNNFHLASNPSIQKDNGSVGSGTYSQNVPSEFFIRSVVMDASGDGLVEEYFNGIQVMTSTDNFPVRSDNFYLGDVRYPIGFNVDFAEVIVYDQALDSTVRQAIESYLQDKYLGGAATAPLSDGPYTEIFHTDLVTQMQNKATSAYLRTEFDVANAATLDQLNLRLQYDDGFIAYLNGVEVARANAPAVPQWNSSAVANRADEDAVEFELFDISAHLPLLTPSGNVLSIQGLNVSAESTDFLLAVELDGYDNSTIINGQFFSTPTPGSENGLGQDAVMLPPEFSISSQTFTGHTLAVELTTDQPGAEIRYTLNEIVPLQTSVLYTGPIVISDTTQIRARVFHPEHIASETVSETYLKLNSNVQSFTSDLPIVVLDSLGAGRIPTYNPRQPVFMAIFEPDATGRTSLTGDPTIATRAGFRIRGSSSQKLGPQDSFRIETWNEEDDDKDISPFGMPAESDWILNGPTSNDRLLFRNDLMYELSNQMGRYAVRTQFVEVYVNSDGGELSSSDFAGLYSFMETIKRGNDRMDVQRLYPNATTEPEISGGHILVIDHLCWVSCPPTQQEVFFKSSRGLPSNGSQYVHKYPGKGLINSAQRNWVEDYIDDFEGALYGGNFTHPEHGYAKYIDVDSFLDGHWLGQIAKNEDNLRLSTYFHIPRGEKMVMGPTWDYDQSMADSHGHPGTQDRKRPEDWHIYTYYDWWGRLFQDPDFEQKWIDRYQQLSQTVFSEANIHSVIDSLAAEIEEAQARHFERFSTIAPQGGNWQTGEVDRVKQWYTDRIAWIATQFTAQPSYSRSAGLITPGEQVSIAAPSGSVYYTTDGSDPRKPGGGISSSAKQASGPITLSGSVQMIARAVSGGDWSGPHEAFFTVQTPTSADLAITEINYNPAAPTSSELSTNSLLDNDDFEFIEIQNIGTQTLNLAGLQLTDGVQFTFGSTTVSPGERVVVIKDLAAFARRYGTGAEIAGEFSSGSLSNSGETIRLADQLGNTILEFRYGDDDPWPESSDGAGATLELIAPGSTLSSEYGKYYHWRGSTELYGTPGSAGLGSLGVVINEVLAHTDPPVSRSDTIELHNTTSGVFHVGGWYLSDSESNLTKFVIPDGTTIAAGGYISLDESDFNANPGSATSFALSGAHGDSVWLVRSQGGDLQIVDNVHFGSSLNGESFARIPNGVGRLVPTASLTLGTSNGSVRTGPLMISEVQYNAGLPSSAALLAHPTMSGEDLEFIEILNISGSTVDLTDWRIRGGQNADLKYDFVAGTTLSAGDALLVTAFNPANVSNSDRLASFRAHYGLDAGVTLVGGYSGHLDDNGQLVVLEGPDAAPAEEPLFTPHFESDGLLYDNLSPWPPEASGTGKSLHRIHWSESASLSTSWVSGPANPGAAVKRGDFDLDGDVDTSDLTNAIINFTSAGGTGRTWADGDTDGDGDVDTSDLTEAIINFTGARSQGAGVSGSSMGFAAASENAVSRPGFHHSPAPDYGLPDLNRDRRSRDQSWLVDTIVRQEFSWLNQSQ